MVEGWLGILPCGGWAGLCKVRFPFMARHDFRSPHQVRPISFQPGIAPNAQGSVLVAFGSTRVICAATVEESVPRWMKEQNVAGGWLTAEYSMLPYSTGSRKARDITRGRMDGRSTEIQRLIGRSLRAVVDLEKLGARTLWVDCDVLQADGGTRTAAITGASVAVELAMRSLVTAGKLAAVPVRNRVAAVSVGVVGGEVVTDLDYLEDRDAAVDMNVVMTQGGDFVEVQGSGEEAVFSPAQLHDMLEAARAGLAQIFEQQKAVLNS